MRQRVLSYGGGLDSFVMLVRAIQEGAPPDVVVFVDVADGSRTRENEDPGEWPGTYRHIREVVIPLCERQGIEFVWLTWEEHPVRDARSLFAWMMARQQIPVAGPNRLCTTIAKVERFEAWLTQRYGAVEVEVWIGFEAGEESRAKKDPNAGTKRKRKPGEAVRVNRFPLIEWKLCRCRCEKYIRSLGLPVPRKSACVFCPYASKGDWQVLARELPAQFVSVASLEQSKPPTKNGKKLSIMGYRTLKDAAGNVTGYKAPPLPVFIRGTYRAQKKPCKVCAAERKASKATGCSYLE